MHVVQRRQSTMRIWHRRDNVPAQLTEAARQHGRRGTDEADEARMARMPRSSLLISVFDDLSQDERSR